MSSAPSQLAARTQIARDGRRCGPLSLRPCCGCADAVSAAGGEVAGSAATVEARRPCLFARDRACATMPPCMRECALVMRVGSAVQRAAASSILPVMIAPITMLGALGTLRTAPRPLGRGRRPTALPRHAGTCQCPPSRAAPCQAGLATRWAPRAAAEGPSSSTVCCVPRVSCAAHGACQSCMLHVDRTPARTPITRTAMGGWRPSARSRSPRCSC